MSIFRATATYGRGFMASQDPDIYSVRIYVGGFAGPKTADKRAAQEISAFQEARGYSSHRIITRRHSFIPSYYEYVVQFSRK
jgi:hypothetical protein